MRVDSGLPGEDRARAKVLISGKVQGVFFRAFAKDEARRLRLGGWVSNLSQGNVELLLEGEKGALDQMIEWCRKGPSRARVERVSVEWEEYRGEFPEFNVKF
ncbi:MAG TPA: acylphosphatase [Candidatus Omnitrophota bacterium]|nr:acylphosphatase [Candidatus Omnitrophota bacterium]